MQEEIWKPVPNEFSHLYEVSNHARVRRIGGYPLVGGVYNGYRYVELCNGTKNRRNIPVHRIVALAFIPLIDGKTHVDHINGDRSDNRIENLRWCTHAENMGFASASGKIKATRRRGEESGRSKLTNEKVRYIRSTWPDKNQRELSVEVGVSHVSVGNILSGKTWLHLTPAPKEVRRMELFKQDSRRTLRKSFQKIPQVFSEPTLDLQHP